MEISSQRVLLNTFFDALDGGRASQFLEAEEIDFAIENHSVRQHGIHKFSEDQPAIVMEIYVNAGAGVWSTVRQNVDDDNEKIYLVEVKADRIEQAIESVNRWLSSKEMR